MSRCLNLAENLLNLQRRYKTVTQKRQLWLLANLCRSTPNLTQDQYSAHLSNSTCAMDWAPSDAEPLYRAKQSRIGEELRECSKRIRRDRSPVCTSDGLEPIRFLEVDAEFLRANVLDAFVCVSFEKDDASSCSLCGRICDTGCHHFALLCSYLQSLESDIPAIPMECTATSTQLPVPSCQGFLFQLDMSDPFSWIELLYIGL